MSIPAVSAVNPEIKPSDVPAVPTAQPPICLQSVVIGGNVLVLRQKETILMVFARVATTNNNRLITVMKGLYG